MKTWSLLILLAIQFPNSWGTEVDNFTDRDQSLADSREILNSKMNGMIEQSLMRTNNKFNCDETLSKAKKRFYKKLDASIGGFFWAKFENEVVADPAIDKRYIKTKDSIYKNLNVVNGFAFSLAKLGAIVNIGNHYVGTDKLGHFIGIGKIYFKKMSRGKSLEEAMAYGQNSEVTFFGLATTGVYSYGDLVSNYEGLLFWENFFGGNDPYIKCVEGKLIRNRSFDWLDYVNEAWDESINCSGFRSERIKQKVYQEIKFDSVEKCPVRPLQAETIQRYSETPLKILNLPDSRILK